MDTAGFKFDKPAKKKKRNHSRRNKTRERNKMIKDLDADASVRVKERDGWLCVRCGIVRRLVQWAHVISRRFRCLRWEADNALSLCGGCHLWFDNNPLLSADWFRKNFPERYERIMTVYQLQPEIDIGELWRERCQ